MSEMVGILGKPRSGKTSYCAFKAYQSYKRRTFYNKIPDNNIFLRAFKKIYKRFRPFYDYFYCTDESIQHTITISYDNLGDWKPLPNSCIWLEEAGLGVDNRNYKNLTKSLKHLFATFGHNEGGCDLYWSSQTSDVDKQLRVRTHKMYMASSGTHFWNSDFTYLQRIDYECGVDNESNELVDIYSTATGIRKAFEYLIRRSKILYRKPYYKYFDSYDDKYPYLYKSPVWNDFKLYRTDKIEDATEIPKTN